MNKFHNLFILFLLATLGVSCSQNRFIELETETIEMGQLNDNGAGYAAIKFYNSSSSDVIIDTIVVSTRDIGIQRQIKVAKAKDSTVIDLVVLTNGMDGDFAALVSVYLKGEKKPVDVIVKGNVKATPLSVAQMCKVPLCDLMIERSTLNFGDVPLGKVVSDTVMVYNPTDKMMTVACYDQGGNFRVKVLNGYIAPGKASYVVFSVIYDNISLLGHNFETARFEINRNTCSNNVVVAESMVVEDFSGLSESELKKAPVASIDNLEFNFGTLKAGAKAKHKYMLTNKGKTPLVVRQVLTTCGCTVAKMTKQVLTPGETVPIEVEFDTKGRQGTQQKSISVITNSPENPNITLWITGDVTK